LTVLIDAEAGSSALLMGNEAIARGALEAGVKVAASYPGTPSSEILGNLAGVSKARNLYTEWSVNEKVATEVAAAASYAGLRALVAMKQVGVNVAADFLLHLSLSGTRGGLVLVSCEDPGAFSSTNEGESRPYAKMMEFPLLEIGDFQEAKDITRWAFELSEKIRNVVMIRSVTRLSHSSGNVVLGKLPETDAQARFKYQSTILDPMEGPIVNLPVVVDPFHRRQQEKLKKAAELFEDSPFNSYSGPDQPELLIITSSVCCLYSKEAIQSLNVEDRVGLLKLATTYPLPPRLLTKYLKKANRILIVEEIQPFLEDNIEAFAARTASDIGIKTFYGKNDGTFPVANELNPDMVIEAVSGILDVHIAERPEAYTRRAEEIAAMGAPSRELTFCPGCPHRASFWCIQNVLKLDNRDGFVCGDIGCYGMAAGPTGFMALKTLHAMGSATGLASGFGKLGRFGMDQPVFAVCGDSTFFHAVMPALINAIHNRADITLVILDNSGTAMTGFQAHPGLNVNAAGGKSTAIDIPGVCRAMGAAVGVCDPFDIEATRQTLLDMIEKNGVKVVVLKQICALSPEKKAKKQYEMAVDESLCLGEACGCNRLCTRIFKCPGLIWDTDTKKARVDRVICAGCGVCTSICPAGAIRREEAA
jgi:indolepyruvate ferredoxin oxidoreductase, alpha subunit